MAGITLFPTAIDDNTTLDENLENGPLGDEVIAEHQNNQNVAIKALETKVGVTDSAVEASLDYKVNVALPASIVGITYVDADAVDAMGVKGDANALHHDKYTDANAIAAAGTPIATHAALTATHGTTGAIVGTTDTQALTNKTIDYDLNTITNLPAILKTITMFIPGTITVDTFPLRFLAPQALTIVSVEAAIQTAPTDASLIVDVNKNGTTIFTTQGNRATITTGNTEAASATPDVTTIALNDVITIDIDQVGSTAAGTHLTVQIRCIAA